MTITSKNGMMKMNDYLKKNINLIVGLFLLIGPVIDLITGLSLHILHVNFTLGIVLRVLFLFFLMYLSLFVYKNKKLLIPYSLILLYFIFYLAITFIYKNGYYFQEIQGFAKTFYFPVLFITLYTLKDDINISKMTLFTTFFLYLSFIFLPTIFNVGFKTYEITKAGTLGFFNSANEISGIISLLTPIMFYILITKKSKILTLITIAIYLPVILMMGTKTPLLTLIITTFFTIIYYWVKKIKQHSYKPIIMSFIIILLGVFSLLLIIPKTNFYKNIKTHLDYLEINNITEVFSSYKLFDHFIFSERLSFHHKKIALYKKAPLPQKMFGLGYYNNSKSLKMVEMDYFDIYYNFNNAL